MAKPPKIRSISLYHIRGVDDATGKEFVIYPPEFLYVVDVGSTAYPAVMISVHTSGLGDPRFPDFSAYGLRTVNKLAAQDLIFPDIAGELLVAVKPGTTKDELENALKPYATSITEVVTDLFKAQSLSFFNERAVASEIEKNVSIVRYVETNRVIRLVDFGPGWRVSQVC